MALRVRVQVVGAREVIRAFGNLPDNAKTIVKDKSYDLADSLVPDVRATAAGRGRQATRAAATVKAVRDKAPKLQGGRSGDALGRKLLFGSEFGAKRHFGWYGKPRYHDSTGLQFPPHRGNASYWFFKTVDDNKSRIGEAYVNMAREICRQWGAEA